jgi:hypothetical protein
MRTITDQTRTCDVDASYPKADISDTSTRITQFAERTCCRT